MIANSITGLASSDLDWSDFSGGGGGGGFTPTPTPYNPISTGPLQQDGTF